MKTSTDHRNQGKWTNLMENSEIFSNAMTERDGFGIGGDGGGGRGGGIDG